MLHKNNTAYSKCCSYAIEDFYVFLYPKIRAEKKKNVCMPASKDGFKKQFRCKKYDWPSQLRVLLL